MPQRTYPNNDSVVLDDNGTDPAFPGMLTYNNGNLRWQDGIGTFNPRVYWSNIIDGPDDNWAPTLYGFITYVTGTPFYSQVGWYLDSAKTKPVIIQAYTYSGTAYNAPTQIKWTMYNSAGTAIHTCTDVFTYITGTTFESSRVRFFT